MERRDEGLGKRSVCYTAGEKDMRWGGEGGGYGSGRCTNEAREIVVLDVADDIVLEETMSNHLP